MAVVFIDGMDLVSASIAHQRYDWDNGIASASLTRVQDSLNPTSITQAWCLAVNALGFFARDFPAVSAGVLGIGFKPQNPNNTGSATILAFRDTNNSNVVAIVGAPSTTGAGSNVRLTLHISAASQVSFGAISSGIWHRLELVASIGDSNTAQIQVYVSGLLVLSYVSTVSSTFVRAGFGSPIGGLFRCDDFYILNSTTPGPTSALGSTYMVRTLVPTADTSVSQWSALSAGTALWSHVQEFGLTGYDADTTYIHTSTVSNKAVVEVQDYSQLSGWANSSSETPVAVQVTLAARAPSGAANLRTLLVNNSAASALGATSACSTTTYLYHTTPHNVDTSGASWTLAVISGFQIGVEYVS